MRCHLQASRIWCTQIQCLLNRCRAARHFWQNAFCFLIKLQCPQRHYLLSEKIAVLPDGVFISPPGISPHSRFARSAFRIHRGKVISPFSRSFNFQGAVVSPSTKRQKLKKICIVHGKIFWFNFGAVAFVCFLLSILDCWKNIEKLTPRAHFFGGLQINIGIHFQNSCGHLVAFQNYIHLLHYLTTKNCVLSKI